MKQSDSNIVPISKGSKVISSGKKVGFFYYSYKDIQGQTYCRKIAFFKVKKIATLEVCSKSNRNKFMEVSGHLVKSLDRLVYEFDEGDLKYDQSFGEKDLMTAMEIQIYKKEYFMNLSLDKIAGQQIEIQKAKNTSTVILDNEKKKIDGLSGRKIKYLFEVNNAKGFGDLILLIYKDELFIANIYTMRLEGSEFREISNKIIRSLIFKK